MQTNKISEIETIFKKAEQLRESGQNEEALHEYTKVVYFAPRHWPAYFHLGVLFGNSGHNELAAALLQRSAELNPENAVIKNHLAGYLMKLGRNEEALELLQSSWSLDPSHTNNSAPAKIGKIFWESNRPEQAIPYFDLALSHRSDKPVASEIEDMLHVSRWLRALCRLSIGDYQEAWDDYESRTNIPGVITPELAGEKWLGQSLEGKTIFFAYEQRFGDFIQFIRFIPRLQAMGAKVIVQLPTELARQIRHSFPDIELVSTTAPVPEYDYHQLITSVPAVLNLDKQACVNDRPPYFNVDASDQTTPLPMRNDTTLKVGLLWAGKPDPDRSIPLKYFIPLLRHREVSFYSFQLGEKRNDLKKHSIGWLVQDLAPKISDFYDSSVLLKDIDLLITIDTAIAHQAGALGVPVWVMLRYFSDWRWETNREDNDWYPSMRFFRQTRGDSWSEASEQLEQAFSDWVAQSSKANEAQAGG